MIWYSRWFIHPATAISTKRNGSNTCSIVVHSLSRAWALVPNYRQFKQFQFSVHTTCGIDGPIEVTPTALHPNIGFIDTPGFVGRLEVSAQPLFSFWPLTLNPSPHRSVVGLQAAFLSNSSTSRSESEYRRYQRTAQTISSGAVCRHLKIAGRLLFSRSFRATNHRPPLLRYIPSARKPSNFI